MMKSNTAKKISETYAKRDQHLQVHDWQANYYHPRHPLGQILSEHNRGWLVTVLNNLGVSLQDEKILDFGCGTGSWLRWLIDLGAVPENLFGLELTANRMNIARRMHGGINWIRGTDKHLPLRPASIDLAIQSVVFSSIPDEDFRRTIAEDIGRVIKPSGHLLWIDLKKDVEDRLSGFSVEKVCAYFPGFAPDYVTSVHPRYYRRYYRFFPFLMKAVYHLTKIGCESHLIVLKKQK